MNCKFKKYRKSSQSSMLDFLGGSLEINNTLFRENNPHDGCLKFFDVDRAIAVGTEGVSFRSYDD